MPKAQVLVTVTAEALIEVPEGVDVEAYCRERVSLSWQGLAVDRVVQSPSVAVEHFLVPGAEPEAQPAEAAAEPTGAVGEALGEEPEAAARSEPAVDAAPSGELVELFDDPAYREVIRSAVRDRAGHLIEEIVDQVVAELEPLLERHFGRKPRGAG